jgi:fructose-1,6-bisphosphatase/sedoheptulose 1,7-bisphosphatase-like protein
MLEIQVQLKGKEILTQAHFQAEKIDRLERSRQQTIKEMELLRKEISILEDMCPKEDIFF